MRKAVPHDLSKEEHQHLVDFHGSGLMRKALPPAVEEKLIQSGFIRRATGGHVVTNAGMEVIYGREQKA